MDVEFKEVGVAEKFQRDGHNYLKVIPKLYVENTRDFKCELWLNAVNLGTGDLCSFSNTASVTKLSKSDWFNDASAFHQKFGLRRGLKPSFPDHSMINQFRTMVIQSGEQLRMCIEQYNIPAMTAWIFNHLYILMSMCVSYGIDPTTIWDAGQKANLAKVIKGEGRHAMVVIPEDWAAPDMDALLKEMGYKEEHRHIWNVDDGESYWYSFVTAEEAQAEHMEMLEDTGAIKDMDPDGIKDISVVQEPDDKELTMNDAGLKGEAVTLFGADWAKQVRGFLGSTNY